MKAQALRLVPSQCTFRKYSNRAFLLHQKVGSLIVQKKEEKQRRKYCVWLNIFCIKLRKKQFRTPSFAASYKHAKSSPLGLDIQF